MTVRIVSLLLVLLLIFSGCQPQHRALQPPIVFSPPLTWSARLPSAFPPLSKKESGQDWAKELLIGNQLARDGDFYRAITAYKRALILLPADCEHRRMEIEANMVLSYYSGNKYFEVIAVFEHGSLTQMPPDFPVYDDILVVLIDCYHRTDQSSRAFQLTQLLEQRDFCAATKITLGKMICFDDFPQVELAVSSVEDQMPETGIWLDYYRSERKSPQTAQRLNALLPGAGYLYVGQKQTAVTSFLLNTLFTFAAYRCFDTGNIAAGLLLSSLEFGWYVGGINGAGLAALEYNEHIYRDSADRMMKGSCIYPILMVRHAF